MFISLAINPTTYIVIFLLLGVVLKSKRWKRLCLTLSALLFLLFSNGALYQWIAEQWYKEYDRPLPERKQYTYGIVLGGYSYWDWKRSRPEFSEIADLMDNGLIEDPYYRLNERSLQWIDKEDWIYEVSFDAGALTRGYEHIRLEFLGLDTYADVFLNETQILTADNMFRRWAAEVKPLLKERGNVLRIYFH